MSLYHNLSSQNMIVNHAFSLAYSYVYFTWCWKELLLVYCLFIPNMYDILVYKQMFKTSYWHDTFENGYSKLQTTI